MPSALHREIPEPFGCGLPSWPIVPVSPAGRLRVKWVPTAKHTAGQSSGVCSRVPRCTGRRHELRCVPSTCKPLPLNLRSPRLPASPPPRIAQAATPIAACCVPQSHGLGGTRHSFECCLRAVLSRLCLCVGPTCLASFCSRRYTRRKSDGLRLAPRHGRPHGRGRTPLCPAGAISRPRNQVRSRGVEHALRRSRATSAPPPCPHVLVPFALKRPPAARHSHADMRRPNSGGLP